MPPMLYLLIWRQACSSVYATECAIAPPHFYGFYLFSRHVIEPHIYTCRIDFRWHDDGFLLRPLRREYFGVDFPWFFYLFIPIRRITIKTPRVTVVINICFKNDLSRWFSFGVLNLYRIRSVRNRFFERITVLKSNASFCVF